VEARLDRNVIDWREWLDAGPTQQAGEERPGGGGMVAKVASAGETAQQERSAFACRVFDGCDGAI